MRIADFLRATILSLIFLASAVQARTLQFSGYDWEVRGDGKGGPGPNHWSGANVWVDKAGWLHLRLSKRDGKWLCPEIFTQEHFGFGRYRFVVAGPIDRLDKNVVLGLFDYPEPSQGPDGTHEIDIEFARWGYPDHPIGNYTVWPAAPGLKSESKTFEFRLAGRASTHTFTRTASSISFESRDGKSKVFGKWTFSPADAKRRISALEMPVHINLWLFGGRPPSDGQEVEIVIRSFQFRPR